MLQNAANALFGAEPRGAPPLFDGGLVHIGDIALSRQALAIIAVAAILIAGQHLLFTRTRLGQRLRATAQDRDERLRGGDRLRQSARSWNRAAAARRRAARSPAGRPGV